MSASNQDYQDSDQNTRQLESTRQSSTHASINDEVKLLIKQIDSLAETLPLTMFVIQAAYDHVYEELKEFVDEYCEVEADVNQSADNKAVTVPVDRIGAFRRLHSQVERALFARKTVPRTFIVSLISHYDAFLGGIIKALFLMKPDVLSASEKNITFSQLLEFGSVENAREYIVEKEVETVLRKSHSEQFDWLETKFGLELRKGLDAWPTFIEVTERRNLFVHSRGIVSNQYLTVCEKHGVIFEDDIQVGQELEVPPDYFNSAYECIFEIGVKLAHVLWRKVQPGDREVADNNLIEIGYNLLAEERFTLARKILDFSAVTLKKHASEQNKRIFVINRAQAYKWSGNSRAAESILSEEDWSATSDDFKLAEAVLLNDFDEAEKLVNPVCKFL
jgi:type IV secretory pathway TrbF-like protein